MTQQLDACPTEARSVPATSWRRAAAGLLLATALVGGLWFLTPANLGGSTTYLVTQGTSMLPTHEPGALVVVRTQDEYAVGDVIAFHSEPEGYIVMHRVVALQGDHYVTRGDNNDYDDGFRPAESDILGRTWIHVPDGADVMARLRSPLTVAVVFGALGAFAMSAARARR